MSEELPEQVKAWIAQHRSRWEAEFRRVREGLARGESLASLGLHEVTPEVLARRRAEADRRRKEHRDHG
jgi:hypothetical protein